MALDYVEYRLRFLSPLRVGDAHWAKANAFPRLHADLLYRALAHAYAELFGSPVDEALPGGAEEPRLRLSSALPYTKAHGPLAPLPASFPHAAPQALFPVHGQDGGSDTPHVIHVPATTTEPSLGQRTAVPWLVTRRVQASFDRRTSRRAQRFTTGELRFTPEAGLWIGVRFADPQADRASFETALAYLGETGMGGGRSVGCGRFEVAASEERSVALPSTANQADARYWVLSRYRPSEREFAAGKLLEATAGAAPRWDAWRRPHGGSEVRFLAEGSVIVDHEALDVETAGTTVRLGRPGAQGDSRRPMIRSGLLFALPLPSAPVAEAGTNGVASAPPPQIEPLPATPAAPEPAASATKPQEVGAAAALQPAPAPKHPAEPKSVVLPSEAPESPASGESPSKPQPAQEASAEGASTEPSTEEKVGDNDNGESSAPPSGEESPPTS